MQLYVRGDKSPCRIKKGDPEHLKSKQVFDCLHILFKISFGYKPVNLKNGVSYRRQGLSLLVGLFNFVPFTDVANAISLLS